jgi:hypothetical protein
MRKLEAAPLRAPAGPEDICFASHVPDSSAVSTLAHPTYIPVESLPHAI